MTTAPHPASYPNDRRRSFLKGLGGLAAAPALAAVLVSGDLYVNNAFGLALRKPSGWGFEHLRTFADLRNEYEFATPSQEVSELLKAGPLPLMVASQVPLLRNLAASLTLYAEDNPLDEGQSLMQASPDIMRALGMLLADFRVTTAPHPVDVPGAEAIEYIASFTYRDRLGHQGPARNRGLLLLRATHLFTLNMFDLPADRIVAQKEFDEVRASVVFA